MTDPHRPLPSWSFSARIRPALRGDAAAYTPDDLAKIAQALQRPLSEAFTAQLHQRASQFLQAWRAEDTATSPAQEKQLYCSLLTHLQAIEQVFDTWDLEQFVERWRNAAPHKGGSPGDFGSLVTMLRAFDQQGQGIQQMLKIVLEVYGPLRRGPVTRQMYDKPLQMFIRQLAYLYTQETSGNATAYESSVSGFERFVAACINPFGYYCPQDSPNKDPQRSPLYQVIKRALATE